MIKSVFRTASVLLLSAPALAQSVDAHAGHVMPSITTTTPRPVDHSTMIGMDHTTMDMAAAATDGGSEMSGMEHSMMNHGGMAMTPAPKSITRKNIGAAEAALQAFSDALEVGNRDLAIARLAPDVTIVENGVEESRADYIGGHLAADIEYQKSVKTVLLARTVHNDGPSRARIVSKIRMIGNRSDKPTDTLIEERALLAKMPDGWKILRVEWISGQ